MQNLAFDETGGEAMRLSATALFRIMEEAAEQKARRTREQILLFASPRWLANNYRV